MLASPFCHSEHTNAVPLGEAVLNAWQTFDDFLKVATDVIVIAGQHNAFAAAKLADQDARAYEHLAKKAAKIYCNLTKEQLIFLGGQCSKVQSFQRKDNWLEEMKFVNLMWWETKCDSKAFNQLMAARTLRVRLHVVMSAVQWYGL